MYRAAVITVSDSRFSGEREDTGGPLVGRMLETAGFDACRAEIVSDDQEAIEAVLKRCADEDRFALVVTTGGTGMSPRDVTPEATLAVCEKLAPGICEAMRAESMRITPRGMLSRMVAGIRGGTLIFNLPGSPKAIQENLQVVLPVLEHAVSALAGDVQECAQEKAGKP